MKRFSQKFLHRVRIHGGEFDASARAMHRDGMTRSFQAAVETVSIATNERKQMSTKTTFKRVALVAVAAMGFGLLSTVPSSAASYNDSLVLSSSTASQLTGETATSTSAVATLSFLSTENTDTLSVVASFSTTAVGNVALPNMILTETTSAVAFKADGTELTLGDTTGIAAGTKIYVKNKLTDGTDSIVTAKFAVFMTAPTKVGVYTVTLTPTVESGGGIKTGSAQTLTITVATNPATDTVATSATVILNKGETNSATSDATVTSSKTVSTSNAAATITVALLNAAGLAANESFTASIAGAGTLGTGVQTNSTSNDAVATGRALTVKNGQLVSVFPDGSSGVGTVTISSALGVILATKKVTFYGATTTLTATVVKSVIATGPNQNAVLVTAADSAGTEVQDAKIFLASSDKTIIGDYTAQCGSYSATNGTVAAPGYLCGVTGVKAGTATVTPTTKTSATDASTTAITGAAGVSLRVGSSKPASVSMSFDKATYVPGEKATISIVLLDKDGLTVADGRYDSIFATGGLAANYTWSGDLSDTTTATEVSGFASGVKKYTVYMPLSEGTVEVTGTTGSVDSGTNVGLATANQAVDVKISATVASSSTGAATDAANEATDAANAATDAANAAAEAADAATAAAQDAADAVATLSTQVATLISALKAQITSLTNLVIKIQKKVKA